MALNKPILSKPAGESTLGSYGGGYWNNEHHGTDGPITCEICGTDHPEDKDGGYMVSTFLGLQVVEECCGRVLDVVYGESGQEFCQRYLEEFADNPADPRYFIFRKRLAECMARAFKNMKEVGEQLLAMKDLINMPDLDLPEGGSGEKKGKGGRLLLREGMKGGEK